MLSEIDINNWVRSEQTQKLYEVPNRTLVSPEEQPDLPIMFYHVDGMYSYCKLLNTDVVHLQAWADVFTWSKK